MNPGILTLLNTGITPWQSALIYFVIGLLIVGLVLIMITGRNLYHREKGIKKIIRHRTGKLEKEVSRLEKECEQLKSLASVAVNTDSGVVIADTDGKIEWVNSGFTQMTGYTFDKLKERGSNIIEASWNPGMLDIFNKVIRNKRSMRYESEMINRYGKKMLISAIITPIYDDFEELRRFVVIDTDVTQYVQKSQLEGISEERKKVMTPSGN